MWLIWLMVVLVLCLIGMVGFWIFSKIWMAIKRDEMEFQKELKEVEEKEDA